MAGHRKEHQERLAAIYEKYPRKMGKSAGWKTAIAQCKTMGDLDQLELAISHYCAYVKREGTERQYILYFSTFMHQWRDWLDSDTGSVIEEKLDLSDLGFEA
jgi:hypothetical protein